MQQAQVNEVFASIQGEGPWIGQRHIFVRFQGCDIRCRYCDTPASQAIEHPDSRNRFCTARTGPGFDAGSERIANPLSREQLGLLCSRLIAPGPSRPVLSLTGGEPLLQVGFLASWLPMVRKEYRIYLETSGIHDDAMKTLAPLIDVVSMDVKLPSATGLPPFWEEHRRFLAACRGRERFIKAVVTAETYEKDVLDAARLIAESDPSVPLILQPAGADRAPAPSRLMEFQDKALGIIEDVRVIPQMHKLLKIP